MNIISGIQRRVTDGAPLTLFLSVFLAIFGGPALSQEVGGSVGAACDHTTLGGLFCAFQASSVVKLITFVMAGAFLGGLFLFYKGILKLIKVTDAQGSQETLSNALLTLAAGAFLVAFPTTIMVGLATFGIDGAWNYNLASRPGDAGAVAGDSFLVFIANFAVNAAGPLATLVMGIAVLIGLVLVASAVFNLANLNSPQTRSPEFGAIVGKFVVGICLVNIFYVMAVIGTSFGLPANNAEFFTTITTESMEYARIIAGSGDSLDTRMQNIMLLVFAALIPFGLIAFVRGLLIIKDATDGSRQVSLASGVTHIVGGVALVNSKIVSCSIMTTLTGSSAFCLT